MKMKVVVGLHLGGDPKKCSKALTIAVGFPGVTKASLEENKSKISIEAEGLDPVKLITKLKKKLGHAELLLVKKADDKDEKESKKIEHIPIVSVNPMNWAYNAPPHYYYYDASDPYHNPCAIM